MANASQLTGDIMLAAQGIYSESSTALHQLGQLVHSNDGRSFRYAKAGGTTLVPGKLQQSPAEDTSNFQNLTVTAPAAGATSIVTTSTVTLTVNQLAGAFLTISTASTNAGQVFRVAGNTAATAAVCTFYLDDPVVYAPTGTTKIDVHPNPYNAVVVNPATASSAPVGVALYKVTNAYFGWLQVKGPTSILADGTITVGTALDASNGTAGAVEAHAEAGVQAPVGTALTGVATTEYGMVQLNLA